MAEVSGSGLVWASEASPDRWQRHFGLLGITPCQQDSQQPEHLSDTVVPCVVRIILVHSRIGFLAN